LGILLLVLEFKTPGFGFFGITGAGLLVVVFLSNYVAGVAGYESILLVFIGAALIIIELLLVPGILVLMGIGFVAMLLGLVWMLADIWPTGGGGIVLNPETFVIPIIQVFSGLIIAMLGAIGLASLLPRSFLRGAVILDNRVGTSEYGIASGEGGGGTPAPDDPTTRSELPGPGTAGTAATDLFPTGSVEIDGKRYEARANLGTIDAGTPIRVVKTGDYALIVEEDRS
jgi:membrane-bound serine protease (ClpP class)